MPDTELTCRRCDEPFTIPERAMTRVYEARGLPIPDTCPGCRRRAEGDHDAPRALSPLSRDVHALRLQLAARDAELERMRGTVAAAEQRARLAQAESAALRVARDAALRLTAWGGARR